MSLKIFGLKDEPIFDFESVLDDNERNPDGNPLDERSPHDESLVKILPNLVKGFASYSKKSTEFKVFWTTVHT